MRRTSLALVTLALMTQMTVTAGCGGLTRNHKQGLAVVGGVAVVMGGTLLVDGMSCDEANWNGADCRYDGGELRNGAVMVAGGAALLTWALIKLSGDDATPEASGPRTARSPANAPAPTAAAAPVSPAGAPPATATP